ncbi:M1 family metallopeptidase [Kordia algicida OT-1]|uniref:Aminopeptidase N n=1 Tax=Kordia algicida OT-1 TaxID=391587 RepID=A9E821_9FLAO|nr:M1 family metallopeptidase [Kordia algicida]EDP94957.1 peptidase M1, membrane alanine aminopeptidase [Kordia algicida OT-1]
MKTFKNCVFLVLTVLFVSCLTTEKEMKEISNYANDTHSYAKPNEAVAKHLILDVDVDFDKEIITGTATYTIESINASEIVFDAKNLVIQQTLVDGKEVKFKLGANDPVLGQALIIPIEADSKIVAITYETTDKTEALQFLNPQQTADKEHPFLLTQGQAILTRTWIPIQDSPQVRLTYSAKVKVPKELMAIMSAENPKEKNDSGQYRFEMKQPISPYLIALAVGDLVYKEISPRTGVYAEKSMIDKVHYEFADMEKMVKAAEDLYGAYAWDQFDVVVLPPSFPFGGMENPRLTFATPTVIAGDRSLTSLIAHELAHSWSGNLVTNATWNDFWLNEGFTVYFEMRIMEALYGKEYANMLASIGRQDLSEEIKNFRNQPEATRLKLDLEGKNPDDGMNSIAYDKGYLFLRTLEEKVGREKMDAFLKDYFNKHAFSTMTTEKFVNYLHDELLLKNNVEFNVDTWVYKAGIPGNASKIISDKFSEVNKVLSDWQYKTISAEEVCEKDWNIQQKIHFIRNIPEELYDGLFEELDSACNFSNATNSYIAMVWFEQAINHDYHGNNVDAQIENFLMTVGRRWYVSTIYKAFKRNGKLDEAKRIYEKARPNYHSVTVNTIDEMLGVSYE